MTISPHWRVTRTGLSPIATIHVLQGAPAGCFACAVLPRYINRCIHPGRGAVSRARLTAQVASGRRRIVAAQLDNPRRVVRTAQQGQMSEPRSDRRPRHRHRSRSRSQSRSRSRSSRHRRRHRSVSPSGRHPRRRPSSRSPRRHRRHRSRSRSRSRRQTRSRSRTRAIPSPPRPNPELIKQLLSQSPAGSNPQLAQVTRQARRLYCGNLPIGAGFTEAALVQFFTNAAIASGITTPNPVVSVWTSSDGSFCFVECRAVSDATRCIDIFDGLMLGGRPLRVGRPADYMPAPDHLDTFVMDIAGLPAAPADCTGRLPAHSTAAPPVPAHLVDQAITAPTRVILLTNMCSRGDLLDKDEYDDILLDVREECQKFGPVEQVWIPKPSADGPENDPPGVGKIWVQFDSVDHASAARDVLKTRSFNGKLVGATFYPESKFIDRQAE